MSIAFSFTVLMYRLVDAAKMFHVFLIISSSEVQLILALANQAVDLTSHICEKSIAWLILFKLPDLWLHIYLFT